MQRCAYEKNVQAYFLYHKMYREQNIHFIEIGSTTLVCGESSIEAVCKKGRALQCRKTFSSPENLCLSIQQIDFLYVCTHTYEPQHVQAR